MAGLAAAQLLRRAGHQVVVLDPVHPGGRARTDDRGGVRWNRGPHALYLGGPAEQLLHDLGVRWTGQAPGALHLSDQGRVGVGPSGVGSLITTPFLGTRGRVAVGKLFATLGRVRAEALVGRAFADWHGSLGLPTDAAAFVSAVARVATYAHAPDLVDAGMVVAQMQQSGRHGVRYLDGGWQLLVDQLVAGLDVRAEAATEVRADAGTVHVSTADGVLQARAAVVALATPAAAAALLAMPDYPAGPPVEAACLDLTTTRPAAMPLLLGIDQPHYLSDHGVRARLAPEGRSVVHVARYLAPGEEHEPAATRAGLEAHAALAGLGEAGAVADSRYLHRMTVVGALPLAAHGGLAGRPEHSGVDGVFLAGDWVGPTGHLLDAALASARVAAERAARLVAR